jgi:hypothetical protein
VLLSFEGTPLKHLETSPKSEGTKLPFLRTTYCPTAALLRQKR